MAALEQMEYSYPKEQWNWDHAIKDDMVSNVVENTLRYLHYTIEHQELQRSNWYQSRWENWQQGWTTDDGWSVESAPKRGRWYDRSWYDRKEW